MAHLIKVDGGTGRGNFRSNSAQRVTQHADHLWDRDAIEVVQEQDKRASNIANTHNYAGLMSADAYIKKKDGLTEVEDKRDEEARQRAAEAKARDPVEIARVKALADEEDAEFAEADKKAREARSAAKKRKLQLELRGEVDDGAVDEGDGDEKKKKKKKKKKKDKARKKQKSMLTFQEED